MTTGDLPELEPLEEVAELEPAPAPAAAAPAGGAMPVSLGGMPAPLFGMRAQKEYYRFFFCGLLIFMGCLMPWGHLWDMAGWQSFKGGIFTIIALGIMWSSWVAISHNKFDLSSMRWLILATIPLISSVFFVIGVFEQPDVVKYIAVMKVRMAEQSITEPIYIDSWGKFFSSIMDMKTPAIAESFSLFMRYSGPGQYFVLFGSVLAEVFFIKGILSGIKAGKTQKQQAAAARDAAKKSKRR